MIYGTPPRRVSWTARTTGGAQRTAWISRPSPRARYVSLTTFRRDGTPVATPVWVAQQGDELRVLTGRSSGKAKRLRHNSRVLLAPCDMRGRVTGDVVEGTARLQDDAETAVTLRLIRRRYGLQARLLYWWEGRRAEETLLIVESGSPSASVLPGPASLRVLGDPGSAPTVVQADLHPVTTARAGVPEHNAARHMAMGLHPPGRPSTPTM